MNNKEYDSKMRKMEAYHGIKAPPGLYKILRLDGRSFSRFTSKHFVEPFDVSFSDIMSSAMINLMTDLDGLYGQKISLGF